MLLQYDMDHELQVCEMGCFLVAKDWAIAVVQIWIQLQESLSTECASIEERWCFGIRNIQPWELGNTSSTCMLQNPDSYC